MDSHGAYFGESSAWRAILLRHGQGPLRRLPRCFPGAYDVVVDHKGAPVFAAKSGLVRSSSPRFKDIKNTAPPPGALDGGPVLAAGWRSVLLLLCEAFCTCGPLVVVSGWEDPCDLPWHPPFMAPGESNLLTFF